MGLVRRVRESAFIDFVRSEVGSAVMLVVLAGIALVWANSRWAESYFAMLHAQLTLDVGGRVFGMTLHAFVNDFLMALFFLVVGLEIKRELLVGELSSRTKAALPLAAALGGMLVPALIYVAFNAGTPTLHGWGVPMATDIAFALGVLALLGDRVPVPLKVFLTALAIFDDLGAVIVIALFYTAKVSLPMLGIAAGLLGAIVLLFRMRVRSPLPYVVMGLGVWLAVYASGVHSTIAGILLAMTVPLSVRSADGDGATTGPLERLESAVHPVSAYLVLPLFALFNAGVHIGGASLAGLSPVTLGVFLGLLLGKQLGVVGFSFLAIKAGIAQAIEGVGNRLFYGVAWLTGIGFTMALFVTELAFKDAAAIDQSKVAIIAASLVCGVVGYFVTRSGLPAVSSEGALTGEVAYAEEGS